MTEFTDQQIISAALDYLREKQNIAGDPNSCQIPNIAIPISYEAEIGGKPAHTEYVTGQKWQITVASPRRARVIVSRELDGALHGESITLI